MIGMVWLPYMMFAFQVVVHESTQELHFFFFYMGVMQ